MQSAKVLYVLDDGLDGIDTLKQVLAMAEVNRWNLTLFGVVESVRAGSGMLLTCMSPDQLESRELQKRLAQIEALISIIRHDYCCLHGRASFGNRAREILREASNGRYDLVIKYWRDDSTDRKLERGCQPPVWLLKPEDFSAAGGIIAANTPPIVLQNRG